MTPTTDDPPFNYTPVARPNLDLINKHVSEGNVQALRSLFEALWDQRNRAEYLARSYFHELAILEKSFKTLTADIPKKQPTAAKQATSTPTSKKSQPEVLDWS